MLSIKTGFFLETPEQWLRKLMLKIFGKNLNSKRHALRKIDEVNRKSFTASPCQSDGYRVAKQSKYIGLHWDRKLQFRTCLRILLT